jgi:hypothetical protein|tara:strand:+ start:460 stop:633 length:174 start_codon:yes stop_codon:yes gene_type:complete
MKEEKNHHTDKDKDMLKDKKKYKDEYVREDINGQGEIENLEKDLDTGLVDTEKALNM